MHTFLENFGLSVNTLFNRNAMSVLSHIIQLIKNISRKFGNNTFIHIACMC